ncbi:MAG: PilZ domain-containing protein [Planctomycetota bacterium]
MAAVTLYLGTGEEVEGEILSGDGRSITVGLPASRRGRIPLGQPTGLELHSVTPRHRISVVATRQEVEDGVDTVRLVLSNRASISGAPGSAQTILFNERSAFRLPVNQNSVTGATICSVSHFQRATRPGVAKAVVRGNRYKAKVLDVSYDGLGVLVSEVTEDRLQGAEDVHLEIATISGKLTVEGLICHRTQLPRGAGFRYGIAAGASRVAKWRDEDERLLRRFVTEQQRMSLARLRRA